jgi:hypothetical protein
MLFQISEEVPIRDVDRLDRPIPRRGDEVAIAVGERHHHRLRQLRQSLLQELVGVAATQRTVEVLPGSRAG